MSLYLLINLASFSIPFIYSFEKRMHFIRYWKEVFSAIAIVALLFIAWDVIFTDLGVWGFNPDYLVEINLFNLPIEEWLFFICIPYASIFTHYALRYFFPKMELSKIAVKSVTIILLLVLLLTVAFNTDKLYTFYNFGLLILVLGYCLIANPPELKSFYITFLAILIPFFIVNGILTGSFIDEPVVWYNNIENLGIRLGTIPIEDIGYAFSLIFMSIILIEKLKKRKSTVTIDE